MRVTMNWQKNSINFAYGYAGEGVQADNPGFEIATAYPKLDLYYGFLSGFAYSLP
jgi:hypothetical protein